MQTAHSGTVRLPRNPPAVRTIAPSSSARRRLRMTMKPLFHKILLTSYLNSRFYKPASKTRNNKL